MPLYEYECRDCRKLTEVRHGFDETVAQPCAACGGELVRRFSPTGIVFKGSGFYVTDSRKSTGAADGSKADAGSKSDAAGKSDSTGKSDSAGKSETAKSDGASVTTPAAGGAKDGSAKKGEGAAA